MEVRIDELFYEGQIQGLPQRVRTEPGGQNNDGTYTLTWVVPSDTSIDKYQYQCQNHASMRGTINVSNTINVGSSSDFDVAS